MAERDVEIREFRRVDTGPVAVFLSRHFSEQSAQDWEAALSRILWDNPNVSTGDATGWVLHEINGGIVGFLGNVRQPFYVSGREVRAAATTAWCVSPRYRSLGLLLADAFMEQRDTELLFNTTANQTAGDLFARMGFERVPATWFSTVAYWITKPTAFVRGATVHLTGSRALATFAGAGVGIPLAAWERFSGRRKSIKTISGARIAPLLEFGAAWQRCWEDWRGELVTGVRTPEQLSWRLGTEGLVSLGATSDAGVPLGYVTCRREVDYGGWLTRLRIVDLWAQPGRAEIIWGLMHGASRLASDLGCGCLEVNGLSESTQQLVAALRPRHRQVAAWPYFYRAIDRSLAPALADSHRWYPTGYDGDSAFSLTG